MFRWLPTTIWGDSGLGEDTVPVGYSCHRGGAGWETCNDQVWCLWSCGFGGVISEGIELQGTPALREMNRPSGAERIERNMVGRTFKMFFPSDGRVWKFKRIQCVKTEGIISEAQRLRDWHCPLGLATRITSGLCRSCFNSLGINHSELSNLEIWGKINTTALSRSLTMPERRQACHRKGETALRALVASKTCSFGSYHRSIFYMKLFVPKYGLWPSVSLMSVTVLCAAGCR